ncbi:MAG: helix-turn-helix domain-containing protein [Rikenellaceae bacterium]|nr:helix-turn-helix domain-containing protein [Rikenellaceae bacterium]
METNPEFELAYDMLTNTRANIFLTGKAGTGKTTFLRSLSGKLSKAMVVVAPTGVAALNAGGMTIHSFFQITPGPYTPMSKQSPGERAGTERFFKLRKEKIRLIRGLQLLVIDEISMVRSDLLDAISDVLCRYRRSSEPFGGVQLLMIGDMQQLSPVVRDDERDILARFYKSPFFFDSLALQRSFYTTIELKRIYRQSDRRFTDILNSVRTGIVDRDVLAQINKRYIPGFTPRPEEGYITLTTHNSTMQSINDRKLTELEGEEVVYEATVNDDFPELIYPTEYNLRLKVGAQVMFVRNDSSSEHRFYNGKLGVITRLCNDWIEVKSEGDSEPVSVARERWDNTRYSIDEQTQEITSTVVGLFIQFPLRTAWAITIHKSQGLTFDRAVIDVGGAFAHGQVYVALSRCRTLEGLVLSSPIRPASFVTSAEVASFNAFMERNHPDNDLICRLKRQFYAESLCEMFDFSVARRHLLNLQRLFNISVGRIYPAQRDEIVEAAATYEERLFVVADKFCRQLRGMIAVSDSYDDDPAIAGRVSKGAAYMLPLAQELISLARKISSLKVDNKDNAKVLKDNASGLLFAMRAKIVYMQRLGDGFSVEQWLRVKWQVEQGYDKKESKEQAKTQKHGSVIDTSYLENVAPLFATLVAWRKSKAQERGVPHYSILSQRAMIDLCEQLPCTAPALEAIHGVGKVFMQRYGAEVLDIITDFCNQSDVGRRSVDEAGGGTVDSQLKQEMLRVARKVVTVEAEKRGKGVASAAVREEGDVKTNASTYDLTLAMYKGGNDVRAIAEARGLSVSTVAGHMARLIESGRIDVHDFMDAPMVDEIISALNTQELTGLRQIYDHFMERYSYDEIKYVIAHNNYLKNRAQ